MWQHLEDQKVLLKYRILIQALCFLLDEIGKFFSLVPLRGHKDIPNLWQETFIDYIWVIMKTLNLKLKLRFMFYDS